MAQFEIVMSYTDTLSAMELREVLGIIDEEILKGIGDKRLLYDLERDYLPFRGRPTAYQLIDELPFSFLEIKEVRAGSVILVVAVTGLATWALTQIERVARQTRLGDQLERSGILLADIAADILESANNRLEHWAKNNRLLRDRKTEVKIKHIETDGERESIESDES